VRRAIEALGVERIGHGVRAVEDRLLMEWLVARGVPLEVCPTSNVRTGVVTGWDDHPAAELIAAGAVVTLNSDDPTMFDTSVAGEFRAARRHLGADDDVLHRLAANAIEASWAGPATKRRLLADLDAWWAVG
jgi:adenosine deaminase